MNRFLWVALALTAAACSNDGPDIRADCPVCEQADEVCRVECEPDYDTCIAECASEDLSEQPACELECDADLATCPDECDVDLAECNTTRC